MNDTPIYILAFALGAVAGLRSMTARGADGHDGRSLFFVSPVMKRWKQTSYTATYARTKP